MKFKIDRPPQDQCETYFDTAKMIANINHPVGSREWMEQAEVHIKRYGHHEKLGVHESIKVYYLDTGAEAKDISKFVESKIKTHQDFASRPDDMMIYGRGRWRNTPPTEASGGEKLE